MNQKTGMSWRVISAPTIIGWISVCLLAGAYGRTLDDRWQQIWAQMGALGLAAALGLGSIDRLRQARLKRLRELAMQARFEFGLDRLHQHTATLDSINAAVRQLAHQASTAFHGKIGTATRNRRRDQLELLADYPLEIVPVDEKDETSRLLPSIPGMLQQVSSRVVSFEHDEPFHTRMVMLNFHTGARRLSFVVEMTWTQRMDDAYCSGGTVLAVGVPSEEQQAEFVGACAAVPC